jgi:four helix bundle protein
MGDGRQGTGDGDTRQGRAIQDFRDLRVWQCGIELAENIHRLSEQFPKSELYGLTSQVRRAVVSVPSNIAEGHTRESTREYLQYLSVAQGSLAEVFTQIELAVRFGYVKNEDTLRIRENVLSLGRQIYALRNALARKA